MLVYLHNPSHEACDRFVREKLLTRQMKELIDQNNIVLWGASVRTQEGYKGIYAESYLTRSLYAHKSHFVLFHSYTRNELSRDRNLAAVVTFSGCFVFKNNIFIITSSITVSMALRENTYPFLGLICMRDNRMVMVGSVFNLSYLVLRLVWMSSKNFFALFKFFLEN